MAIDWQSRRDGFDHRRDKPTDRPINWKYWASLPALKQWEACALSVNINPDNLKAKRMVMPGMPVFLPESFPSRAVELEFDRRLTMFNRNAGGNHSAVVRPQWFAGWCGHVGLENLPPELVAMAAIEPAPVVEPEPTTAPVLPAGDGTAKPLQRTAAQDAAILNEIKKQGHDPKALPRNMPGKSGVKRAIRDALDGKGMFVGETVFSKAWERLTSFGEIAIQD